MAGFDTRNALNLAIRALRDAALERNAGGWIPPKERERQQIAQQRDMERQQKDQARQEQAQQKQFIADEKERQKNLMAWHKQSHDITKNPDGSPKVFYHGTQGDFSTYDLTSKRKNNANNPIGIYVTGSPEEASNYATKYGDEIQDSNVMPVHVHIKNPFLRGSKVTPEMLSLLEDEIVKNNPHKDREYAQSKVRETIAKAQRGEDAIGIFPSMDLPNEVKARVLQAGGYDGFTDGRHLIALDPSQIKSATGNQGTFDPSERDITKSEGGQILSKQFPTQYMPNVGRQVMQDGGVPSDGDHPRWIPTRLPKTPKNRAPNQIVDYDTFKSAPGAYYSKNMDHIRNYINIPESVAKSASDDELAEHFINHVKNNLLDLHDSIPEEVRNRSKLWYDGARAITDRWSQQYNLPDHSVAGVLAALSPQMDWFKNVSLANRVIDIMDKHHDYKFDDNMLDKFSELSELAKKPEYANLAKFLHGKSMTDIDNLGLPEKERIVAKSLWLRTHDETYGDRRHQIVSPEGDLGDYVTSASGAPKGTGWGSFNEIGKAIKAIELKDEPEGISPLMGMKHKVRNFYNNILAPNSTKGDVTIDTHAVAAGLYRPLSGNSLEVAHNLGTSPPAGMKAAADSDTVGLSGTYPIFAEAYRRAAAERGILPRQMQSITWEAVRSLYPDTLKRSKKVQDINDVWNQHRNGLIDQSQAREMSREIALGKGNQISPPSWFGSGVFTGAGGANAPVENTGEQGIVSGLGVSGQPPEDIERRARGGSAQGSSQTVKSRHPALSIAGTHIREEEHGTPIFTGRRYGNR